MHRNFEDIFKKQEHQIIKKKKYLFLQKKYDEWKFSSLRNDELKNKKKGSKKRIRDFVNLSSYRKRWKGKDRGFETMPENSSRNRNFSPNKQLSSDTGKVFVICGVYARISEMYFNYEVIRWSTSAMRANSTLLTSSMHPPSSQHRLFDTSSKENPRVVARPRKLEKNFKGNRLYPIS